MPPYKGSCNIWKKNPVKLTQVNGDTKDTGLFSDDSPSKAD